MKICVIGSKGQLGSEIIKCIENGESELGKLKKSLEPPITYLSYDLPELDIGNIDDVMQKLGREEFDVIINCAAYTDVNGCETNRDTAFKVNALGPRNLAIAAKNKDAKLIHVSTDYVFDGKGIKTSEGIIPYAEWDAPNPQSIYGKSKLLGEQYVKEFSNKYFIVRTSWLYGYNGNNFVKTIARVAKEKGAVKVVNDQIGNPTNAADLAHHILRLSVSDEYGIYHATGKGECSWFDFAKKIVEFSGIDAVVSPCSTDEYPTPAKRPAYSSLDNMAFRNAITLDDEFREWEVALKHFIDTVLGES